jgi:hypothetical protein
VNYVKNYGLDDSEDTDEDDNLVSYTLPVSTCVGTQGLPPSPPQDVYLGDKVGVNFYDPDTNAVEVFRGKVSSVHPSNGVTVVYDDGVADTGVSPERLNLR